MAKVKIRYSPEAKRDMEEIRSHISDELHSPAAARNTIKTIFDRISSLKRHPFIGEALDDFITVKTDYRKLVCGNYIAFYRIEKGYANIIRVLYGPLDYLHTLFGDTAEYQPVLSGEGQAIK